MPSGFNRFTQYDRCRIQALKTSGLSQRGIVVETGCPQPRASS